MPLTDNQIKGLKPAAKPYGKADGGGLQVFVTPAGAKSFRTRYRFEGKPKTVTHGLYPGIGLAEARRLRDEAKALLASGIDPMAKAAPVDGKGGAVPTSSGVDRGRLFSTVVDEWWVKKKLPTLNPSNLKRVHTRVFDYLAAPLANRPVDEIEPKEILAVIQAVETSNGVATARRVYGFAKKIFAYAKVTHQLPTNPAADLEDGLSAMTKTRPRPFLAIDEVPRFYMTLRNHRGRNDPTVILLELYMHTVLRNSELRWARWADIANKELTIPEGSMKVVRGESLTHIVPLSRQSLALLSRLHQITGDSEWLFPRIGGGTGKRSVPVMCENTTTDLYEAMGYKGRACNHGWKKTFSTAANESGLWNSDWIEFQLAHHKRSSVRGIYNKAKYLKQRHEMMQWWSDQLSEQERIANDRMALEDDLSDILG